MSRRIMALVAAMMVIAGTAPAQTPTVDAKQQVWPGKYPFTAADVEFVSGMIHHHAQAILMAGWAKSHGASNEVQVLCARIINAQTDEITLMQRWLKDRKQPVPVPDAHGMKMMMNGVEQAMLMPGMLTETQLKELDAARGPAFDRLFLRYMIKHHQGALDMAEKLFATAGAGQDEQIYKLASDVQADQSTEIVRMQKMFLTSLGN